MPDTPDTPESIAALNKEFDLKHNQYQEVSERLTLIAMAKFKALVANDTDPVKTLLAIKDLVTSVHPESMARICLLDSLRQWRINTFDSP